MKKWPTDIKVYPYTLRKLKIMPEFEDKSRILCNLRINLGFFVYDIQRILDLSSNSGII